MAQRRTAVRQQRTTTRAAQHATHQRKVRRAASAPRAPSSSAALPQSAGTEFQKLVDIMRRLRGPDGCPWDREQTIESLRPFILEETYEVLDAIDRTAHDALRGEIGDLLFEGVFLAQIETDEGRFTITDSIRAIADKLVRRHPHIFGETKGVGTAAKVIEQWEQIKGREQHEAGQPRSILKGVPKTLPALLRAYEIGTRVAAVGFDWTRSEEVIDKIEEEIRELHTALSAESRTRVEEEMGDLLFSVANLARKLGLDPESALRAANDKFSDRFAALERDFERRGRSLQDATLEEMEAAWQRAKLR